MPIESQHAHPTARRVPIVLLPTALLVRLRRTPEHVKGPGRGLPNVKAFLRAGEKPPNSTAAQHTVRTVFIYFNIICKRHIMYAKLM